MFKLSKSKFLKKKSEILVRRTTSTSEDRGDCFAPRTGIYATINLFKLNFTMAVLRTAGWPSCRPIPRPVYVAPAVNRQPGYRWENL